MSEKLFRQILRLYPARFHEEYGDEALQLFRDRMREERGFFAKARLWADLLIDAAVSIPRQHGTGGGFAVRSTSVDGSPVLFVLEDGPPRTSTLVWASALSLTMILSFSSLMAWDAARRPMRGGMRGAVASGSHPTASKTRRSREVEAPSREQGTAAGGAVDATERRRVIEEAIASLKQNYADAGAAEKTATALREHERRGDNDGAVDGSSLAARLTTQMQAASGDKHLEMAYSRNPLPATPSDRTAADREMFGQEMERQDRTIEKLETLAHNIGYLKFNFFVDPAVCGTKMEEAMARVNDSDAVIFDLRENRGGDPAMVELVATHLLDHPEYWFSPRENASANSWTKSPVAGSKLADKAVFVLTSKLTLSGAEQFCYNLKMLKRATLVGETTGGASHAGVFHRLDDHFGIGIREVNPINPYGQPDWEGIGVKPDIEVAAADALETARKLALKSQRKRH